MGKPSKWAETLMHLTCFLNLPCSDLDREGAVMIEQFYVLSQSIQTNSRSVCTHQPVSFVHKFTEIITDLIIVAFK